MGASGGSSECGGSTTLSPWLVWIVVVTKKKINKRKAISAMELELISVLFLLKNFMMLFLFITATSQKSNRLLDF
jgi:hypothetical protein